MKCVKRRKKKEKQNVEKRINKSKLRLKGKMCIRDRPCIYRSEIIEIEFDTGLHRLTYFVPYPF